MRKERARRKERGREGVRAAQVSLKESQCHKRDLVLLFCPCDEMDKSHTKGQGCVLAPS